VNELVSRVVQPDRCPARCYLLGLAPTGRRAQAGALRLVAGILAPGIRPECVPWEALRWQHAQAVRAVLIERGYAPGTVNRILAALRGVARAAWSLGLMPLEARLQVADVRPAPGSRLPAGRMLSPEEVTALVRVSDLRGRATVALLYGAGLRVGEACALLVSDLDLPRVVVTTAKGGRQREAWLGSRWAGLVADWLQARGAAPGHVLTQGDGRGLTTPALASWLLRACARAGIPKATPHDLRRTFASVLLGNGVDLPTVQRLMGHADPRTTARYDRRPGDEARRAVEGL
jgi:integrase/recombinase XerD